MQRFASSSTAGENPVRSGGSLFSKNAATFRPADGQGKGDVLVGQSSMPAGYIAYLPLHTQKARIVSILFPPDIGKPGLRLVPKT